MRFHMNMRRKGPRGAANLRFESPLAHARQEPFGHSK
jgi:hypothetical protein